MDINDEVFKLRQTEEALRDSIERFDLAVAGTNEGIWDRRPVPGMRWDDPQTPVWFSPRYKELLGYRDDEFPHVLESWRSRIHPDDRQRVLEAVGNHIVHRAPYESEYRLLTKQAEYRWFVGRGQGMWTAAGELIRMAGSIRDVTEARRVAAELQASEEKWRGLVASVPDIVTVVDPAGVIRFANRTGGEFTVEEMVGQSLFHFIDAKYHAQAQETIQRVVKTGEPGRMELSVTTRDGKTIWYANHVGPIRHEGQIDALVVVTTDITELKRAERALQQERENLRRQLDLHERDRRLIAYEIHDGMVQHMTAAVMHLEAFKHLAGAPGSDAEFDRGLKLLRESVQEARRLISGLRPPVLDELGIVAAIEYLINEIRDEVPEVPFIHRTTFDRLAPPVESAIFRVVQEALSNIRKHSGSRRARIELLEHGQRLRLLVRDWGCGFDPAAVAGDRFGLQGIRQRARLLGTNAVIESHAGQGTSIVLDFPLIHAEEKAPSVSSVVRDADEEQPVPRIAEPSVAGPGFR